MMIVDTFLITFLLIGTILLTAYSVYRLFVKPRVKGFLECHAYYNMTEIKASVEAYKEGKIIKKAKTPCLLSLKPDSYLIKVKHLSEIVERDVEIKVGEKALIEFKLPGGKLECHAYHNSKQISAIVEIYRKEKEELVAKRTTPFTIDLEVGEYSLKAIYTPQKLEAEAEKRVV